MIMDMHIHPDAVRQPATGRHFEELLTSLLVMAWMVEARDPYTGGHLWRVANFAGLLARAAGLDKDAVARVSIGGLLHDLGKIAVPDSILRKPARLDAEEYAVMRTHPTVGLRLIEGHPLGALAREAVLSHHETPDGRGYPHGLAGAAVPLAARLVGICDAFDAMTSTRPYRPGMARDAALGIIAGHLGRQFDQALGARFIALGRAGELDHVIGHSDEGIPLQDCPECGPIVVVRREQSPGESVYCPGCTAEFTIAAMTPQPRLAETDRHGAARDLAPAPDTALIARLVQDIGRRVAAPPLRAAG